MSCALRAQTRGCESASAVIGEQHLLFCVSARHPLTLREARLLRAAPAYSETFDTLLAITARGGYGPVRAIDEFELDARVPDEREAHGVMPAPKGAIRADDGVELLKAALRQVSET
jgi:hypothetical protein